MTDAQDALLGADARARREAVDVRRSVLLQAPAGSGKTTVLVCRLLALLATVEQPEEVLAITFTRKAAAEMRARVLQALRAAAAGAGPQTLTAPLAAAALQHAAARGWELLSHPTRLRIQTIDALNHRLAAQCPILSRAGALLAITASPERLYQRAARRTLRAALADPRLSDAAALLFARLDNSWRRIEALLAMMLARRSHWLPHLLGASEIDLADRVAQSLLTAVRAELAGAMARLPAALLREGGRLAAQAAAELARTGESSAAVDAWLNDQQPLRSDADDLPRWRLLVFLALTDKGTLRKSINKSQGFPTTATAGKQQMLQWLQDLAALPDVTVSLQELQRLPDARLPVDDGAALAALSALLTRAAAELQLEFAATGEVDHSYVAAAARQALTAGGEPTDLALRFGSSIRHVLVDEFQDTSTEQIELLRALTAGWSPGDGRTLFAVGDPMQSIYQFREAEVGLFLQARDHGIGDLQLECLELRRNFRSGPGIVDWVNARIAGLFPPQDNARLAAVRYLPSQSAQPEYVATVQVHASADDDAPREAAAVVTTIREVRARRSGASIAVLVASRRHAAQIAAALTAAGIAVRGVDIEPLGERPCVRDLMALTRALQHHGDRTAWLALLHSPLCGLELPDLQLLAEDNPALPWEMLQDDARLATLGIDSQRRLQRLRAALLPVCDGHERLEPLWSRVDRCWVRLGGPAVYGDPRDLGDMATYLAALGADRDAELLAGEELQGLLDGLYAGSSPGNDAVEILTMHGAKGLEWDVVIVPGLGRATAHDTEPLLNWLELPRATGGSDLLLAPISAVGERPAGSLSAYILWLRARRLRMERARLLYVTATRARLELHWFGHAVAGKTQPWEPPARSLLALLWPAVEAEFNAQLGSAPDDTAVPAAPGGSTVRQRLRLTADWLPPSDVEPLAVRRLPLSLHEPEAAPEYIWVGQTARAIGTIVHAELQRMAVPRDAAGDPADPHPDHYQAWLAELGVPLRERGAAAASVVTALMGTRRDERGQWLLAASHRDAHSERRLTGIHRGELVNIIIDRTFIDEHGQRWIIDYKTSAHEGGALEEFLASEVARYRPQLQRYATLASALGPEPVRAALYFPLLGEFREVPLN